MLEVDVVVQAEHGDDGAPQPRDRRAERDQHVHVGAAPAERIPCTGVEASADDELHRRRERELERGNRSSCDIAPGNAMAIICATNGAVRKAASPSSRRSACHAALRRDDSRTLRRFVLLDVGAIPRAGHGGQQRVDAALCPIVIDSRRCGGVIDRGFHAGQAIERVLDSSRARGAGHAFERQFDALGCPDATAADAPARSARVEVMPASYPAWVYVNAAAFRPPA